MIDDDEIQSHLTNGGPGYFEMPIGVVTTPGTKNPKYVPTEPRPLVSSQRDMEHA